MLLVGAPKDPLFIFGTESFELLFDHRRHPASDGRAITAASAPAPGAVWCADAELLDVLATLEPFLAPAGPGGWLAGAPVMLEHETLRAAAVFRYDNPGSVALVARPKSGADASSLAARPEDTDKAGGAEGAAAVARIDDARGAPPRDVPVPLGARVREGVAGALQLPEEAADKAGGKEGADKAGGKEGLGFRGKRKGGGGRRPRARSVGAAVCGVGPARGRRVGVLPLAR